jgi:hypothetical protein
MRTALITPERLRLLLIDKGMSSGEVADAYGVSRNIIVGLARRNGIKKSAAPAREAGQ